MAIGSSIEWTEATWNPVAGCTLMSAGCKNCYAMRMAARLEAMGQKKYVGLTKRVNGRSVWTGKINPDEASLNDPLSWTKPRRIFVNSMSDLFHKDVPGEFISRVFDVMNAAPQHTFQILTKRPEIAAVYAAKLKWTPNIWMGTSVENALVLHRIKSLQGIPAQVRFLSVEPLLGPMPRMPLSDIHWVIVGGESGPGAREMKKEWVVQIRDRCAAQRVAFFFKQWGGVNKKATGRTLDDQTWDQMPGHFDHVNGGNPNRRHTSNRLAS